MYKIVFPIVIVVLAAFFIYRTWNNNKAGEEQIALGQAFLTENATHSDVHVTDSGLQYLILSEGTGTVHPAPKSKVTVHYEGKLLDGTVFDSSYKRNEPITFGLNQVIKGWQEGVQLMVEGQKMRLFIPSNLGYGKSGAGPIPPSATLIFDVELITIQ